MTENIICLKTSDALSVFDEKVLNILRKKNTGLYGTEYEYIYIDDSVTVPEIKFGYLLTDVMAGIYEITLDEVTEFMNLLDNGIRKLYIYAEPFQLIYQYDNGEGESAVHIWKYDGTKLKWAFENIYDLAPDLNSGEISEEEIEDFVTITLEELSQGFVSHELRNSLNMLEFNES